MSVSVDDKRSAPAVKSSRWANVDQEAALETQRLILEPTRPPHAEELFPEICEPTLYAFIDESPPVDIQALQSRYEKLATRQSPDGSELWLNWVCREKAAGRVVGTVQSTVSVHEPPLLAYVFLPSGQGRGFAREACSEVVRCLNREYDASRIEATVDHDNQRSLRLLVALGFVLVSESEDRPTARGPVRERRYRLDRAKE